ncbi:MFS transporter [Brachyspira hyodysenteriae]|uniref:Major facilitator superfamily MFS 1 n=1 Tax=Brachyspira hyodysenteriae (strain ATCC 49526 / WA1) TaxID=565034 RepID=A0A3B6VA81_BRAHW|nr:MFS transporter [Brachyspira hyodysenteriae]ACN83550.1 major facilitator superfamily MFS 1 [Brachyspira hyodysenteriae WA1]KLI23026.1 MFS transporter [Brachyspira hyodysenteriae]KLI36654.1 MFS transporter [Brachyspira hyodysenteriae]KLI44966.1 MFS transporter [Brachyspira hyodysenteriae]KLI47977.1 MFS transporter [Brachyspira hyodysenteriae]
MVNLLLAIIYLSFISLGLPDALLGSAWPSMYKEFNVAISYAGIISMIISIGTIISSLQSDRLTKKFGAGKITAFSVAATAIALIGFSITHSYWMLCIWAIPYGLGAGSVDASLNNYVALHYESKHMSWLHCMWGIGATIGPYIMGYAITNNNWNVGYRYISIIQIVLTAILFFSLSLWNKNDEKNKEKISTKVLSLKEIINIPGTKEIMICFFCYCAIESTTGLWASSYLNLYKGADIKTAASFGSLFYIGITVGRAISGFITMKLNDNQMIVLGESLILIGIILMIIPTVNIVSLIGFIIIGLGCAPIYPSIIHSTPYNFGAENSQAIIGVQMASAYVGTSIMPPLFGYIANHISIYLLPFYLVIILILMFIMHRLMIRKTIKNK